MTGIPRLGTAYYPEQWPRARWDVDAQLMSEAGVSVVRLAEFAWSRLEPRESAFEFAWLDEAVGIFAAKGLDVILGTPTAAPPAWLIEQHPEILPIRGDGRVHPFGHRRHYCPNQPSFRTATKRIVAAMADHFGSDQRILAWQIDNELGGRCYCDACRAAFQGWLHDRYGSLQALNEVWGTAFWSQEYSAWTQIPLPEGTSAPRDAAFGFGRTPPNPGLALDFRRFTSDSLIGYLTLQTELLRASCDPRQQITHNLMGFGFSEIDYFALANEIDVVSWDNYPVLDTSRRWTAPALAADAMRGLRGQPVWVLEQQVGALGWESVRSPRRGELRLHAWQAIAHGATLVSFFRWRTARYGTEQHWLGFLEANGRVGRRYDELKALAEELRLSGESFAGAQPDAQVALLHDYDSRFALQVQPTNAVLGYEETVHGHYASLCKLGLTVDVVSAQADLARYRMVVAPSLYVMDEATAAVLATYVESGGLLLLAPRTAVKDRCNAVPERPVPAWLDALAGVEVTDFMSVGPEEHVELASADGVELAGRLHGWYEELAPAGAIALAVYADGPFAGTPAITEHRVGDGRAVYMGGVLDGESLLALHRVAAGRAGLAVLELPEAVEAVQLTGDGGSFLFLLNHSEHEQSFDLGPGETVQIGPLDVALVRRAERMSTAEDLVQEERA